MWLRIMFSITVDSPSSGAVNCYTDTQYLVDNCVENWCNFLYFAVCFVDIVFLFLAYHNDSSCFVYGLNCSWTKACSSVTMLSLIFWMFKELKLPQWEFQAWTADVIPCYIIACFIVYCWVSLGCVYWFHFYFFQCGQI